ncbi:hypothetical protein D3C81_873090 [compost metagenome]
MRQIQGHGVGGVGLQLQRMGAGGGGRFDDLQCAGQRLVVIATHLRDHQWWLVRADTAVPDVESVHGLLLEYPLERARRLSEARTRE